MMRKGKSVDRILMNIINDAGSLKIDAKKENWSYSSKYIDMHSFPIDVRGRIGERFISDALSAAGYNAINNKEKDPRKKHWDVKVGKFTFEVKTATMGNTNTRFQHENFESDRDYTALVLFDIAPDDLYLTVAPLETIPFKKANNIWTKNSRAMHRRRGGIALKWDFNLSDLTDERFGPKGRRIDTLEDIIAMFRPIIGNPRKRKK